MAREPDAAKPTDECAADYTDTQNFGGITAQHSADWLAARESILGGFDQAGPGHDVTVTTRRDEDGSYRTAGVTPEYEVRIDDVGLPDLTRDGLQRQARELARTMRSLAPSASSAAGALRNMALAAAYIPALDDPHVERQPTRADLALDTVTAYADATIASLRNVEEFKSAVLRLAQRSARSEGWTLGRYNSDRYQITEALVRLAAVTIYNRDYTAEPIYCFFIGYGPTRAVVAAAIGASGSACVIARDAYNASLRYTSAQGSTVDEVVSEAVLHYLARNRQHAR